MMTKITRYLLLMWRQPLLLLLIQLILETLLKQSLLFWGLTTRRCKIVARGVSSSTKSLLLRRHGVRRRLLLGRASSSRHPRLWICRFATVEHW